jgi:hypothetical protein
MHRRLTAAAVAIAGTVLGSLTYTAVSAATTGPGVHPGSDASTVPVAPDGRRADTTKPARDDEGRHEVEGDEPGVVDPEDRAEGREDRASEAAEPEGSSGGSLAEESQENSGDDAGDAVPDQQDDSEDIPDD